MFLGMRLPGLLGASAKLEENPAAAEMANGEAGHGNEAPGPHSQPSQQRASHKSGKTILKELPPIVTNLSEPGSNWIRIQVSIVYDPSAAPHADVLMSQLTGDIVAYLRTVSMRSIEGTSGLRRLHEELADRASIRSEGAIQELIVQSLVVQ